MIIIVITISIVYAFILIFLTITWYKDVKAIDDIENRMLQLEKRIEDIKKNKIKCDNWLLNEINERLNEIKQLDIRIQKLERKRKRETNESV